jgi:hypothetical protein
VLDHSQAKKTEPVEFDHLEWLLERARQGDPDVLPELRRWLDQSGVWKKFGDLGQQVRDAWVRLIASSDLVLRESLLWKLSHLQGELTLGEPTPIERLLIDRVLANWLRLHYAELAATQVINRPKLGEYWDRRQSRAERAYLASLGALTTMRKFLSVVTVPGAAPDQRHDSNSQREGSTVDRNSSGPPLRLVDSGGA